MKTKLAYLVSRIDPRHMLLAYFALSLFLKVVTQTSPLDGGTGPT